MFQCRKLFSHVSQSLQFPYPEKDDSSSNESAKKEGGKKVRLRLVLLQQQESLLICKLSYLVTFALLSIVFSFWTFQTTRCRLLQRRNPLGKSTEKTHSQIIKFLNFISKLTSSKLKECIDRVLKGSLIFLQFFRTWWPRLLFYPVFSECRIDLVVGRSFGQNYQLRSSWGRWTNCRGNRVQTGVLSCKW